MIIITLPNFSQTTDRLRVGQPKANQWAYSQEGL